MSTQPVDWLETKAQVQERPFESHTPLIGPLIVRFRSAWNSVATKWFVRALVQQQNEFNALVVHRLQDIDARLIAQDHDATLLRHDLAELSAHLAQMTRLQESIDQRLARLEKTGRK
ncbi:MAG: hypothetical protein H6988_09365 [Pseudomonadales bacterium]|nr:hypothetical protein [Anaerolineales bacterium]MCB8918579.1 hypothetical protein [Ardenticatenaceae bacterium]MCP5190584.1 hypothetical protein [Pseudomonadales bacterium]